MERTILDFNPWVISLKVSWCPLLFLAMTLRRTMIMMKESLQMK